MVSAEQGQAWLPTLHTSIRRLTNLDRGVSGQMPPIKKIEKRRVRATRAASTVVRPVRTGVIAHGAGELIPAGSPRIICNPDIWRRDAITPRRAIRLQRSPAVPWKLQLSNGYARCDIVAMPRADEQEVAVTGWHHSETAHLKLHVVLSHKVCC